MNHTDRIELPGLLTIEWLPEVKELPDVKAAVEQIVYSGGLTPLMREAGMSESVIQAYRDSLNVRGM